MNEDTTSKEQRKKGFFLVSVNMVSKKCSSSRSRYSESKQSDYNNNYHNNEIDIFLLIYLILGYDPADRLK